MMTPARTTVATPHVPSLRLLLAPFEMKGTLSAAEVAVVMNRVLSEREGLHTHLLPLGDGGPGTLCALVTALPGLELRVVEVEDALGRPVPARFGLQRDASGSPVRAYLEAAEANGLFRLKPKEREVLSASSRGVGQLIAAALDAGATDVLLGLGGSASNDGGTGALEALGARLTDVDGRPLRPGGGALEQLARVDLTHLDPRLASVRLTLACDVLAPLLGPMGASRLFGPQKGATPEDVERLEAGLSRFAACVSSQGAGVSAASLGAGAAGGLGFGLMAGLHAEVRPGLEAIAEAVGLERALIQADLVLTSEGCLDAQSLLGKGPVQLATRAAAQGVPTIAFVGRREVEAPMFAQVVRATSRDPSDARAATLALEEALRAWHPPLPTNRSSSLMHPQA